MRAGLPEGAGESMWMSGMCPPCGMPSLMSASEISQVEKSARRVVEDMVRASEGRRATRRMVAESMERSAGRVAELIAAIAVKNRPPAL